MHVQEIQGAAFIFEGSTFQALRDLRTQDFDFLTLINDEGRRFVMGSQMGKFGPQIALSGFQLDAAVD
jgi:hypothetical protein